MGIKVRQTGLVNFELDLENLRGYKKFYQDLLYGDILKKAAENIRDAGINKMYSVYKATSRNRVNYHTSYKNKRSLQHIENRLFKTGKPEVLQSGHGQFEITLIRDYGSLDREIPHLKWQEEGTRSSSDIQPYIKYFGRKGYSAIKRNEAKLLIAEGTEKRRRQTGRSNKFFMSGILTRRGIVKNITVPHPALSPRFFIKTAISFVREEGNQIALDTIDKELVSRGLKKQSFSRRYLI